MIDLAEVRRMLDAFDPGNSPSDVDSLDRTQRLLSQKKNPFDRHDYEPGHLTSSAIVLSPDLESVLLVKHARIGRWIQPGGHVETIDASLEGAACREVREETGVALTPDEHTGLVRVDVHAIPPFKHEPSHVHHDLTFTFRASHLEAVATGDSTWMWCAIRALDAYDVEPQLASSILRATTVYSV